MAVTVTIQLSDQSYLSQSPKGVTLSTDGKNPQSLWAISAFPDDGNATTVYSLIRNVANGDFLQFDTSLVPINGERPVVVTTDPMQAAIFLIGGGPAINGQLPVQVMPANNVFLQGDSSKSLAFLGPIQSTSRSGWIFKLAK